VDPLTHTLVGASLAKTGLKKLSPYATTTLILGANAPDIDAVTMLIDRGLSLGFRRGWTHGVLALIILPILLALSIHLIDKILSSTRQRAHVTKLPPLFVLSYISVLTHPVLDWLNTYGVRFLMPFSDRWFYGDALFIIDPWVWLLLGAGLFMTLSQSLASITVWAAVCIITTTLVTATPIVPPLAKIVWAMSITIIAVMRIRCASNWKVERNTKIGLSIACVYAILMIGGSKMAERQVEDWLTERGSTFSEIMAGPLPANPFVREVIVADRHHYHFLELNWLSENTIRIAGPSLERGGDGAIVRAALTAPHVRGLRTWMRFPSFTIENLSDGYRVSIRDVRYARGASAGFAQTVVILDSELSPKLD